MMRRFLLLLPLGLVLAGCKTTDSSSTPPTATTTPAMSSSSSTAASAAPPPQPVTPSTEASWAPLTWDMDRAKTAEALKAAGFKDVDNREPTKSPSTWVSATISPTEKLTVYFGDKGEMNQILITSEKIPDTDITKTRARLETRFGKPAKDLRTIEKVWRLPQDAHTTLRVHQTDEKTWTFSQERGRGKATGDAGMLDLAWGAKQADIESKLKAKGFTTKALTNGVDGCKLPNAPPNCVSNASVSLQINKTEGAFKIDGSLSISKADGLTQITLRKEGFTDTASALKEMSSVEAGGGQVQSERSQRTTWTPGKGEVILETRQRGDIWAAFETYHPAAPDAGAPK